MKAMGRTNNRHHRQRNRGEGWLSFFAETPNMTECRTLSSVRGVPLGMAQAGDRLRVQELSGGQNMTNHLIKLGLVPGKELQVVSRRESGSVMVAIAGKHVALGASMAHHILCTEEAIGQQHIPTPGKTRLREICIGCKGRVVGYQCTTRSYKRRLLSMGLTPGTEFTVTRHAPLGDPTEIKLRGFSLTLRKDEADALHIEEVN